MRRVGALLSSVLSAAAVLAAPPAPAVELAGGVHEAHVSTGSFNVFNRDPVPEAGWEVSFAPRKPDGLPRWIPELAPTLGAMATSGGSLYAYAGFRFDVPLWGRWRLTPQWATGLYYANGRRGLGGPFEFRSGIELSRETGRGGRIGLLFYHLSNAGFYQRNPGSESLVLTYSAPSAPP